MARKKENTLSRLLERFSHQATVKTGSSLAFILAVLVILIWLISGPIFGFSHGRQSHGYAFRRRSRVAARNEVQAQNEMIVSPLPTFSRR